MLIRRRRIAAVAVLSIALTGAGVAFAAWLTTGTGDLGGRSGTAVALEVDPVPGDADLYPGGTGALSGTVTNPNSYPVTVTEVTYGETVTPSDPEACPGGTVTTAAGAPTTIPGVTIAPGTTEEITIPGALTMAADAPTGCQGQTFDLTVTVTQPGT